MFVCSTNRQGKAYYESGTTLNAINTKTIILGPFFSMKSQLSRKITKLGETFNIKEVVTGFLSRTSFLKFDG